MKKEVQGGSVGVVVPTSIREAVVTLLKPFAPTLTENTLQEMLNASTEKSDELVLKKPYTRKEAAKLLAVSLNTLNRYLNAGKLKRVFLSNHAVRVDAESINNILTTKEL